MPIEECDVPSTSVLDRRVVASAYFRNAYRAPLIQGQASVIDVFRVLFIIPFHKWGVKHLMGRAIAAGGL